MSGIFKMTGGVITGSHGSGVAVKEDGEAKIGGTAVIAKNTNDGDGGGIRVENNSQLIITGGVISNNTANRGYGGGIHTKGEAIITDTAISGNRSDGYDGGGIFAESTLNLSKSIVSGNHAGGWKGGGIYANSDAVIRQSTIQDNHAETAAGDFYWNSGGGGIYANGRRTTIEDTVIEGNSAKGGGGGVFVSDGNDKKLELNGKVLIKDNQATSGGGIWLGQYGSTEIKDGVSITGNRSTGGIGEWYVNGGGGIFAFGNGSIIMNGGEITHNTAQWNGGGIYTRSEFVMNGGIIANNTACDNLGGGLAGLWSHSYMYGGEISHNQAQTGGGIGLYEAKLDLDGGLIDQNTAYSHGGGICVALSSELNMAGGTISNNQSTHYEGGGLALTHNGKAQLIPKKGNIYIRGNKSLTTEHWGGGGIFVNQGAVLKTDNLVVRNNQAGGFGGGVGGCSTGELIFGISGNSAIYGNSAEGNQEHLSGGTSSKHEDHAAWNALGFKDFNDYFCAHKGLVYDTMLGGGSANWKGSMDNGIAYSDDKEKIEVIKLLIEKGDYAAANYLMALSANPDLEALAKLYDYMDKNKCVIIEDNYSNTHGGGIMANGVLMIGTPESNVKFELPSTFIQAEKNLQNESLKGNDFTFVLYDKDGKEMRRVSNDENGKIRFDFEKLEEGSHTFYLMEEPIAGSPITFDESVYRIEVKVKKNPWDQWNDYVDIIYKDDPEKESYKRSSYDVQVSYTQVEQKDGELVEVRSEDGELIQVNTVIFENVAPKKEPETPEIPEIPEKPTTPETPDTPTTPETPDTPVIPEIPENPGSTTPGTGRYERPDRSSGTVGTMIPDEAIPLAAPETIILDEAVPLADRAYTEIFDEDVPLYGLPKTGDTSLPTAGILGLMFMSLIGAVGIMKRRKEE